MVKLKKFSTYFERNIKKNNKDAYYENGYIFILGCPGYDPKHGIDWDSDPYSYRSWRWLLNSFKWMDSLLFDYLNSCDESSIEKCVDYFLEWYVYYFEEDRDEEFLWKDDAVSFRSLRISIIAERIRSSPKYSDRVKSVAEWAVKKHYEELINEKKFKKNNHGIFQLRGLLTISSLHSDIVSLKNAEAYAERQINFLWMQQYGDQGIHLENSTAYHYLAIRNFREILASPEFSNCNIIFGKNEIDRVIENGKYFYHPNGVSALFGDTNLSKKDPKEVQFFGDKIFNEAGYAFLASNESSNHQSYLAIRTGFPSNIHRHSDDFSFEWSENGEIILQDSGRYSYDYSDPMRAYISSSKAHNTVTVNDNNFPWWGDYQKKDFYKGAVTAYSGDDTFASLTLEKYFQSLKVSYKRDFILVRGRSLRIVDTLISDCSNCYQQWFHLAEGFAYSCEDSLGRLVFVSEKVKLYITPPDNSTVYITKGQKKPFYQGWVSYKEKSVTPRYSVGFIKNSTEFVFDTGFLLEFIAPEQE